MADETVFVIGATGRTGAALCRRLTEAGQRYVPVVRDAIKWRALALPGERRVIDLSDPRWIGDSLAEARVVISCAHARYTASLLAATPEHAVYVLLGSFRRFAQEPDGDGLGVQAGEAAFLASGRRGAMLHPGLIYGGMPTRNLAEALGARRVVLLPRGGRVMVQPIHLDDVASCLVAAAGHDWQGPRALALPGPEQISYAGFLRRIAAAAGQREPLVLRAPAQFCGPLALGMPGEDQAMAGERMVALLGVRPVGLAAGLARCFADGDQLFASRRS